MTGLRTIAPIGRLTEKSKPSQNQPPPPAKSPGRPLPDLSGRFTHFPQGPELLHLGKARDTSEGGPGAKPEDFPGTEPEYVWFWASRKYYTEPDPLIDHDWVGSPTGLWLFQDPENPDMPREAGGSVSDFVYIMPSGQRIIVRIEGFYWHIGQGAGVQARDAFLIAEAGDPGDQVHRVNDGEFMDDAKGGKAVLLLAKILANDPDIGQLQGGIVEPPRYAVFL